MANKPNSRVEDGEIGFVSSVFGQQHEHKYVADHQNNGANDEPIQYALFGKWCQHGPGRQSNGIALFCRKSISVSTV